MLRLTWSVRVIVFDNVGADVDQSSSWITAETPGSTCPPTPLWPRGCVCESRPRAEPGWGQRSGLKAGSLCLKEEVWSWRPGHCPVDGAPTCQRLLLGGRWHHHGLGFFSELSQTPYTALVNLWILSFLMMCLKGKIWSYINILFIQYKIGSWKICPNLPKNTPLTNIQINVLITLKKYS